MFSVCEVRHIISTKSPFSCHYNIHHFAIIHRTLADVTHFIFSQIPSSSSPLTREWFRIMRHDSCVKPWSSYAIIPNSPFAECKRIKTIRRGRKRLPSSMQISGPLGSHTSRAIVLVPRIHENFKAQKKITSKEKHEIMSFPSFYSAASPAPSFNSG